MSPGTEYVGEVKDYRSGLPVGLQDTHGSLVSRHVRSVLVELRQMPVVAYVRHSRLHTNLP